MTLPDNRKQIILDRSEISEKLAGQYVDLYDFASRPLEVRWNGVSLPYRVFSKDQRGSHTAVVENKRLGHALAIVKAQQELKQVTKIMNNSEKTGYKKSPRAIYGPDFVEKTRSRRGGNAGLMEGMGDRTMRPSCLPPFPRTLETVKVRRFPHYAPR